MKRKILSLLVLALIFTTAASQAGDLTVEEIVAKNIEARGGMEAIKAVQSARISGTMSMQGMEAPIVLVWKRPSMVRMEFTIQGMKGIQCYDGKMGWSVMPFMGKLDPEEMAEDELKSITEMADFDGTLVDYADKGHSVELLGEVEMEGTPAYKLMVTKENGDIEYLFLDTEYFLEFRTESKREIQGMEMETFNNIGDYKEVGDLIMAHSMEVGANGQPFQTITMTEIEIGFEVEDDHFTMPAPKSDDAVEGE